MSCFLVVSAPASRRNIASEAFARGLSSARELLRVEPHQVFRGDGSLAATFCRQDGSGGEMALEPSGAGCLLTSGTWFHRGGATDPMQLLERLRKTDHISLARRARRSCYRLHRHPGNRSVLRPGARRRDGGAERIIAAPCGAGANRPGSAGCPGIPLHRRHLRAPDTLSRYQEARAGGQRHRKRRSGRVAGSLLECCRARARVTGRGSGARRGRRGSSGCCPADRSPLQ